MNTPKRIVLFVARLAGLLLVIILLLAGSGFIYQSTSEAKDQQQYLPAGQLVDIGGYRLHLHCTGHGSPTVILESGLAGPSLMWTMVQREVEKVTQVCSYDRAGLGWSEAGPLPRTSQQMVKELHSLLHNAGIEGPYVLVGHSLGGLNVRVFAHEYPNETAGIVLVASGSEYDDSRMPSEYKKVEESNLQSFRSKTILSRLGIVRLAGKMGMLSPFTVFLAKYPPDLQKEFTTMTFYHSQYWETAFAELSAINVSRAQVAATGSLGDLPLIVLSGSPDVSRLPPSFPVQQIKQAFKDLQMEMAGLSTQSTHVICDTCDHYIPMTNPVIVVDVIKEELDNLFH